MPGLRSHVIWLGAPPSAGVEREFANRDLNLVQTRPGEPVPGALASRGVIFSFGRFEDDTLAARLRREAKALVDYGVLVEVIATDDATLDRVIKHVPKLKFSERLRYRVAPPPARLAEDLARHPSGVEPKLGLEIVLKLNREPLASSDQRLLQRAFHDCSSIALVELSGGRSDARVFAIHLTEAGSAPGVRPQPLFAKVDAQDKIEIEARNYRRFADRFIPFGLRPNIRDVVQGYERSLLVGDFVDRSESLWDLVQRGVAAQAIFALFDETLAGWRHQGYAKSPVTGSVARLMGESGLCNVGRIKKSYMDLAQCDEDPAAIWARLLSLSGQVCRTCPIHGDLHGDNVRVCNGRSILIDLASVQPVGPLTADVAALESWLAFELPHQDRSRKDEFENPVWRCEISRLYSPAAFVHPPGPCDPTSEYHWMTAVVRQLRQIGIAAQSCPSEYQTAIAVQLLRRCQWEGSGRADLYRRSQGYVVASQLARHLTDACQ